MKIFSNFVAFSEYPNFKGSIINIGQLYRILVLKACLIPVPSVATNQTCSVCNMYVFILNLSLCSKLAHLALESDVTDSVFLTMQLQAGCLGLCNRIWAERICNYFCIKTRGDANLQIGKYKTKVAPNLHCTLVIETNARHSFLSSHLL